MKYLLIPTLFFLAVSITFSQRKKTEIFYDFGNGGGLAFTKEQYDSLNNVHFNEKDSTSILSKQKDILREMYDTKRDKTFKNMSNLPLPDFDAKDTEWYPLNTAQYRGRVLILHFWMFESNNLNFKQTIPELNRFVDKYQKDGLVVLSLTNIALGEHEKEVLKENPLNFPLIENAYEFANAYFKMQLMRPCFIIVDKNGMMRYFYDSNLVESKMLLKSENQLSDFEQKIVDLLK
jgi:peroxiredoxin